MPELASVIMPASWSVPHQPGLSGAYSTYASGHWLFGFASKKYHPIKDLRAEAWESLGLQTRYYTTTLHKGAFALPAYVEQLLAEVE